MDDVSQRDAAVLLGGRAKRAIIEQEAFSAMLEIQRQDEAEGVIPAVPWLVLRKCDAFLELVGAIILGSMLGSVALVFSFFVFTRMLHMRF